MSKKKESYKFAKPMSSSKGHVITEEFDDTHAQIQGPYSENISSHLTVQSLNIRATNRNVAAVIPEALTVSFNEGVASGDPRENSVVLWTRAVPSMPLTTDLNITLEVAPTDAFASILYTTVIATNATSDYTLRSLVTGLSPATWYWYRFRYQNNISTVGRTRTAPLPTDTSQVNFAWVSCANYEQSLYDAYAQIIIDDEAALPGDEIHFVLHVGDFVYETKSIIPFTALDDSQNPIALFERDTLAPRVIDPFPSGGFELVDGRRYAVTLDDYRHMYKQVLKDANLRAVRARWPIVQTWDDHEFTNDGWQTQANYQPYGSLVEPAQQRKVACNQAWFEFVPAQLSGAPPLVNTGTMATVNQQSADFVPTTVTNTYYTNFTPDLIGNEPNNIAAINSMTIYRSFRFGKNCEIMVMDARSYRSDHPIPEDLTFANPLFPDARNLMPKNLVEILDQGYTAPGPPATLPLPAPPGTPNPNVARPPGTMLGAAQKAWLKDCLTTSDATWKILGTSVPFAELRAPDDGTGLLLGIDRINQDAWDGYGTERAELMNFIDTNNIPNVVSCTGDYHMMYAGYVKDTFPGGNNIITEFTTPSISSSTPFQVLEFGFRPPSPTAVLRPLITFDAVTPSPQPLINNYNVAILYGTAAAVATSIEQDVSPAPSNVTTAITFARLTVGSDANPHIRHVDTNSRGFGVARITPTDMTVTLVSVHNPVDHLSPPVVDYRVTVNQPVKTPGVYPTLDEPFTYTGSTLPFPVNLYPSFPIP